MTIIVIFVFSPAGFATTASFGVVLQQAEKGSAEAQYKLGNLFLEGWVVPKDRKKAAEWFRKSAEQGYAKSQYHLGLIYMLDRYDLEKRVVIRHERDVYSEQLKKMREDALKWLKLAYLNVKKLAESGGPEAQFILSRIYFGMLPDIKDRNESSKWQKKAIEGFQKIVESGSVKAQRNLGKIYAYVSLNNPDMIKWYTKAANQGDAIAQYELGSHYEFTKEYKKAIEWLTKASEQGHIEAQYALGKIYNRMQWSSSVGNEIKAFHNDIKAVEWLKKAAQNGHIDAQYNLAFCYHSMEEFQDCNEALKWYTRAAEQGHLKSQVGLAQEYNLGMNHSRSAVYPLNIPQDYKKAFKWYKKVAEHEDAHGIDFAMHQSQLAEMYFKGQGVDKDYDKAIELYKKAAEHGNSLSQYSLGEMYYKGLGTEKNLRESAKWHRKAAKKGYGLSQYQLSRMYYKGEGIIQDYVEAYKWANLAAMKIDWASSLRDKIKKDMTPEQIAEGQRRASEFHRKQEEKTRKLWESLGIKK